MNEPIKYIDKPEGRVFTVGDIHGEDRLFIRCLRDLRFDFKKDIIIAVGDLIDRGPNSWRTLDLVFKEPWFYSCRGNHEDLMFDALLEGSYPDYVCWQGNGGDWWTWGHNICEADRHYLMRVQAKMPIRIQVGNVGFCHAMPPRDWLNPQENEESDERIMWGRKYVGEEVFIKNIDHVYVGHTPHEEVTTLGNITYLDTGVCFGINSSFDIVEVKFDE